MDTVTDHPMFPTIDVVVVDELRNPQARPYRVTVPAYYTATPGLVITPGFANGELNGCWKVTQIKSGRSIPAGSLSFEAARYLAARLSELPIDWDADLETMAALGKEHGRVIAQIINEVVVEDIWTVAR